MAELKPCPFCGGDAVVVKGVEYFWVTCLDCKIESPCKKEPKDAIEFWNRRANNDG